MVALVENSKIAGMTDISQRLNDVFQDFVNYRCVH